MLLLVMLVQLLQDTPQFHAVDEYNHQICRKLGSPGDVHLVEDPEVRAGISPDGQFFISTALFARARNEAQLAGVIAHEIAHVSAHTKCIRYSTAETIDTDAQEDRKNEGDADQTAIRLLTKAGYDPIAMLDFFSKYRRESAYLPDAYSARDLLMERLEIEATDHPLKNAIINTPEFDRIHSLVK